MRPFISAAAAVVLTLALWHAGIGTNDTSLLCIWLVCTIAGIVHSRSRGFRCLVEAILGAILGSAIWLVHAIVFDIVPASRLSHVAPLLLAMSAIAGLIAATLTTVAASGLTRRERVLAGSENSYRSRYLSIVAISALGVVLIAGTVWAISLVRRDLYKSAIVDSPLGVADTRQYEPIVLTTSAGNPADHTEGQRIADIAYGPHGWRNKLDLNLPENGGPWPVIIYIHGGGWAAGDKQEVDGFIPNDWVSKFLSKGYAIVRINYRLTLTPSFPRDEQDAAAKFPAQILDCKAAVRFLRANAFKFKINGDRIAVMGHSAGGHLAALLATTAGISEFDQDGWNQEVSSRVQVACVIAGPTDLRVHRMQRRFHAKSLGTPGADNLTDPRIDSEGVDRLIGESVELNHEKALWASPITYVSKDAAPILLVNGFRDYNVPPQQSELFYCALRERGAEADLLIVPGAGHGGPSLFNTSTLTMVQQFFARHLSD